MFQAVKLWVVDWGSIEFRVSSLAKCGKKWTVDPVHRKLRVGENPRQRDHLYKGQNTSTGDFRGHGSWGSALL